MQTAHCPNKNRCFAYALSAWDSCVFAGNQIWTADVGWRCRIWIRYGSLLNNRSLNFEYWEFLNSKTTLHMHFEYHRNTYVWYGVMCFNSIAALYSFFKHYITHLLLIKCLECILKHSFIYAHFNFNFYEGWGM